MVVAVNKDLWLGQVVGQYFFKYTGERGLLRLAERDAEVSGDVPVREELQFAAQQGAIVFRQDTGAAGFLEGHQGR